MRSAEPATWALVAFYTMVGGFVGALAAAIPGLIDLLSLSDPGIKKTAITHMSYQPRCGRALCDQHLAALQERHERRNTNRAVGHCVAMARVSGWLGGKMVHLAGVGVGRHAALASQVL
jgi:hypothetical protein